MTYQEGWNERKAIQFRMTQLEDEMGAIRNEFQGLLDRLRELDRLEAQEQRKKEQQSYFFPTNEIQINTEEPSVPLAEQEPPVHEDDVPLQHTEKLAVSEMNSASDIVPVSEEFNEVEKNVSPTIENEEETNGKEKDSEVNKLTSTQPSPTPPKRRVAEEEKKRIIVNELKREKRLSTKEIREFAISQGLAVSTLNKLMSDIVNETPQIMRVGRGMFDWDETKE